MKRKFRNFKDAKKWVQSKNIETKEKWVSYCKSRNKPKFIPTDPVNAYKKEWISWGDWLRDGKKIGRKSKFCSFDDARKFVHSLNLTNAKDYRKYHKSGKCPSNISSSPERTYKNKGWVSWGDWLGTGTPSTRNRKYRSFTQAKKFVHALELKNENEWNLYSKSDTKPNDIPQSAKRIYKKEWIGMGDWLGTGIIASQKMIFQNYDDAKRFSMSLKLKNAKEWQNFYLEKKPDNLPMRPDKTYKNKGWISWGDFLGTGIISNVTRSKEFLSFIEAKKVMRELAKKHNLQNSKDWWKFAKSGKLPKNIPTNPQQVYSKKRNGKTK